MNTTKHLTGNKRTKAISSKTITNILPSNSPQFKEKSSIFQLEHSKNPIYQYICRQSNIGKLNYIIIVNTL